MLDSVLREKYKKLQERRRKFVRYNRPAFWILASMIAIVFVVFGITLIVGLFFDKSIDFYVANGLIWSWWLVGFTLVYFLGRKSRVYKLTSDELVALHSLSTLENIQNYFESKTSELKEEYRRNALKSSKKLLSAIERYWTIGDFGLGRKIFGGTLFKLKGNFRNKLIPNLEKKDEKTINQLEKVMYNFLQHLHNPTIEGFNNVNKMMVDIPSHKPVELGFRERYSSLLAEHAILKHVLATAICGFSSTLVYFFGINYIQISTEGSFIAAVSLFGILFAGYLQRGK